MERSAADPARDCRATATESLQLPRGDNAELPPGNPGDGLIVEILHSAPNAQNVTKFPCRDDVGDIVAPSDPFSRTFADGVDVGQF